MDGAPLPGPPAICSAATPEQILDLAEEYAKAATHLFATKDKSFGHRPARLCALHAMELYLQAFLRYRGATPGQIKAQQHNLWHPEFAHCLGLDAKTCKNLRELSENRDYLSVRYFSGSGQSHCPISRLERTLHAIRDARGKIRFSV